tara:strand:+ start:672 stop:1163 length:492 start_codon:yes stop_codon:yes gene_type:complete
MSVRDKIPFLICFFYILLLTFAVFYLLPPVDFSVKNYIQIYKHENNITCPKTHSQKAYMTLTDSHDIPDGVCTFIKTDTDSYYIKQVCIPDLEGMTETLNCKDNKCEVCTGPSIGYSILSVDPICLYSKQTRAAYSYDDVVSTDVILPKCLTPGNVLNPGPEP